MAEEIKKFGNRDLEQDVIKGAVVGDINNSDNPSINSHSSMEESGGEVFVPSPGGMAGLKSGFGSEERERVQDAGMGMPQGPGYEGMRPSMLGQEENNNMMQQNREGGFGQQQEYNAQPEANAGSYPADYSQQGYSSYQQAGEQNQGYAQEQSGGQQDAGYVQQDAGYQQYQPYQEAMGSDVITEISEQVVDEKLSVMRDRLEEAVDFKSSAEVKLNVLDKRLKRIEQIIDILQISLIQKVSEYVTDIKDVKSELIETQKSFKSIAPHLRHAHTGEHHASHSEHQVHHPTHSEHRAHHPQHHASHSGHHKGKKHTP